MFVCVKSNKQLFQIAGVCCLLAVVNVVVVGKKNETISYQKNVWHDRH